MTKVDPEAMLKWLREHGYITSTGHRTDRQLAYEYSRRLRQEHHGDIAILVTERDGVVLVAPVGSPDPNIQPNVWHRKDEFIDKMLTAFERAQDLLDESDDY